jgi:hypothetical protein
MGNKISHGILLLHGSNEKLAQTLKNGNAKKKVVTRLLLWVMIITFFKILSQMSYLKKLSSLPVLQHGLTTCR